MRCRATKHQRLQIHPVDALLGDVTVDAVEITRRLEDGEDRRLRLLDEREVKRLRPGATNGLLEGALEARLEPAAGTIWLAPPQVASRTALRT
jgi:hypothetical protein